MRPEDTQMASGRVDEPDITIPPEALEAAKSAYTAAIYRGNGTAREYHEAMSAACLAMLRNWPGMEKSSPDPWSLPDRLILPLQENRNDKG